MKLQLLAIISLLLISTGAYAIDSEGGPHYLSDSEKYLGLVKQDLNLVCKAQYQGTTNFTWGRTIAYGTSTGNHPATSSTLWIYFDYTNKFTVSGGKIEGLYKGSETRFELSEFSEGKPVYRNLAPIEVEVHRFKGQQLYFSATNIRILPGSISCQ